MPYALIAYANGETGFRAINDASELVAGETLSLTMPAPTLADQAAQLSAAVEAWLDAIARANGYTSLERCISFLNSSVAQWAADAAAALAWRDAVWVACFAQQQAALAAPSASAPSVAALIASLPQPEQFGWVTHAPGEA